MPAPAYTIYSYIIYIDWYTIKVFNCTTQGGAWQVTRLNGEARAWGQHGRPLLARTKITSGSLDKLRPAPVVPHQAQTRSGICNISHAVHVQKLLR